MNTFDYSNLVATAQRLIARFGQTATLLVQSSSGDAWNPVVSEASVSIKAAAFDYEDRRIDGENILRGDRLVYISTEGLSTAPKVGDRLILNSQTVSLVNVTQLNPGGTILLYWAQVRG